MNLIEIEENERSIVELLEEKFTSLSGFYVNSMVDDLDNYKLTAATDILVFFGGINGQNSLTNLGVPIQKVGFSWQIFVSTRSYRETQKNSTSSIKQSCSDIVQLLKGKKLNDGSTLQFESIEYDKYEYGVWTYVVSFTSITGLE